MIVDVHCHLTDDYFKDKLDKVISNAEKKNVVSIITNGLNFKDNLNVLKISEKIKKPLIIHSRGAEKEVLELLETSKNKNFLLHSFTGNFKLVKKIFDNGYFLSAPCNIIRSRHFQDIVKNFNLNQILTETDSPYLSPYKDKMNEPSFIVETIKVISKIKNLDKSEVEKIIFKNFQNFF